MNNSGIPQIGLNFRAEILDARLSAPFPAAEPRAGPSRRLLTLVGMESAAVEIDGLVKRYGRTTAIDGLTLTARRGEVTAILGPNGAGKTSTIEICEGFRQADGGVVRVLGLDPARPELRARVGVMLQAGGVPPAARAGEWLRLVSRFYARPLDPAALLDRLGLTGHARTPYRRLSGGQQQRISLAAAVIGRPELVFLDEPSAGLDPQARHACWDLVGDLRRAGVSVVLTTHHMDEAEKLADHVVIIDRGRVVAEGSPATLTGAERQLRFRARPGLNLDELLTGLPDGSAAKESPAGHYIIEGPASAGVGPELLATVTAWCAAEGVTADDLSIERRTLEDVFLELTGRELR
ncbi:ABC transporter ATP-binding protein [Thermocatellispora tengchongensis]